MVTKHHFQLLSEKAPEQFARLLLLHLRNILKNHLCTHGLQHPSKEENGAHLNAIKNSATGLSIAYEKQQFPTSRQYLLDPLHPDDWKLAKVSPVFKAGERNDPNNYRPISILSTISRVFEKLVYEQLYSYLIKNNLLDSRQSGFRSLHSTVTALLDLTNQWCFNTDRGLVSGILLDFKKAFDTVDHQLLLTKLEYIVILTCISLP